ncbi:MAG: hypothetical protein ACR2LS_10185 [Thermomicrobiales bacterium]
MENKPALYAVLRPILAGPDDLLLGYLTLDREERRFTEHALAQHTAMISNWYQLLALFRRAIAAIEPSPNGEPSSEGRVLRLQFIAASGGTMKLVLDATLAGYYAQALMLVRHLFETWLRLEYLHIRPDMASAWYEGENGKEPKPPNYGTILKTIRRSCGSNLRPLVEKVNATVTHLNSMAHPSPYILQQTVGVRDNQHNVGANYVEDLCVYSLHEGLSATRLIVTQLQRDAPQAKEWHQEFKTVMENYETILADEVQRKEQREGTAIQPFGTEVQG